MKKRRPRRKNNYFTKAHENAIIEYALTDNRNIRSELYIKLIGPAFDELVDKIVYTYKFNKIKKDGVHGYPHALYGLTRSGSLYLK